MNDKGRIDRESTHPELSGFPGTITEMIGTRFDVYFPEFLPSEWIELACLRRNMVISNERGLVFGFKTSNCLRIRVG